MFRLLFVSVAKPAGVTQITPIFCDLFFSASGNPTSFSFTLTIIYNQGKRNDIHHPLITPHGHVQALAKILVKILAKYLVKILARL